MAKVEVLSKPQYSLVLTKEEAEYVMALTQNSMCPPEEEPEDQRTMRYNIFQALKDAGVTF